MPTLKRAGNSKAHPYWLKNQYFPRALHLETLSGSTATSKYPGANHNCCQCSVFILIIVRDSYKSYELNSCILCLAVTSNDSRLTDIYSFILIDHDRYDMSIREHLNSSFVWLLLGLSWQHTEQWA